MGGGARRGATIHTPRHVCVYIYVLYEEIPDPTTQTLVIIKGMMMILPTARCLHIIVHVLQGICTWKAGFETWCTARASRSICRVARKLMPP